MTWSDEALMAHVDGELPHDEAARLELDAAADPALRARIDAHRALATRVGAAFAPIAKEPVPPALTAALTGKVASLSARRGLLQRLSAPAWGAMAACLAAGLAIGVYLPPAGPQPLFDSQMAAGPDLAGALDRQLAADTTQPVRIGLSFRTPGGYCRTFDTGRHAVAGLACKRDGRWRVDMAVTKRVLTDTPYRQAASEIPPEILQRVDEMIVGEALDADGEAKARAGGWR